MHGIILQQITYAVYFGNNTVRNFSIFGDSQTDEYTFQGNLAMLIPNPMSVFPHQIEVSRKMMFENAKTVIIDDFRISSGGRIWQIKVIS